MFFFGLFGVLSLLEEVFLGLANSEVIVGFVVDDIVTGVV